MCNIDFSRNFVSSTWCLLLHFFSLCCNQDQIWLLYFHCGLVSAIIQLSSATFCRFTKTPSISATTPRLNLWLITCFVFRPFTTPKCVCEITKLCPLHFAPSSHYISDSGINWTRNWPRHVSTKLWSLHVCSAFMNRQRMNQSSLLLPTLPKYLPIASRHKEATPSFVTWDSPVQAFHHLSQSLRI